MGLTSDQIIDNVRAEYEEMLAERANKIFDDLTEAKNSQDWDNVCEAANNLQILACVLIGIDELAKKLD